MICWICWILPIAKKAVSPQNVLPFWEPTLGAQCPGPTLLIDLFCHPTPTVPSPPDFNPQSRGSALSYHTFSKPSNGLKKPDVKMDSCYILRDLALENELKERIKTGFLKHPTDFTSFNIKVTTMFVILLLLFIKISL